MRNHIGVYYGFALDSDEVYSKNDVKTIIMPGTDRFDAVMHKGNAPKTLEKIREAVFGRD